MHRSRLILLVFIVLSTALLYNLPRVVIDNSEKAVVRASSAVDSGEETHSVSGGMPLQAHASEIPDSLSQTINILRESLFSLQNQEKKLIFADSLAGLFDILSRYDSAAKYYELKSTLLPGFEQYLETADAYYRALSFTLDKNRRFEWAEKARTYYSKVLELNPDLPDIQVRIGMTYMSGEDPMTGIQMMRKVSEEHPDNELAQFELGMLSVTTGQYDKAIERFEKLLRLNEGNGEAHFYLGYCYFEKDEHEKAREQFEKVIKMEVSPELRETAKKYLENINNI